MDLLDAAIQIAKSPGQTIHEVMSLKVKDIPTIAEQYDFTHAFCAFLDGFLQSPNKMELIAEQPLLGRMEPREYCMLASAVHKLANDNSLEVPHWVFEKTYTLQEPVYALDTKNPDYRAFLRETSPIEYRLRNLFYGENVLKRV